MEKNRHYAIIEQYHRKLSFRFQGELIAETSNAWIVKEVAKSVYNPVFYLPKSDIKIELIEEKQRQSHCPIKGDATYWNFKENPTDNYFAWSYESPLQSVKEIKGLIAFNMEYLTLLSEPI